MYKQQNEINLFEDDLTKMFLLTNNYHNFSEMKSS